ncbi:MAG TPA: CAP domain-containing protein, partial [Parasegetibacter sp.]
MHSLFIGCLLLLSVTSVGTIPLLSCTTAKNLTRREGSRELVMSPDDLRKMEREILQLINKHRLGKNLAALNMDGEIAASALSHSKNMADGKVPFGHDGFSERVAGLRKQINGADSWAENVAYNQK